MARRIIQICPGEGEQSGQKGPPLRLRLSVDKVDRAFRQRSTHRLGQSRRQHVADPAGDPDNPLEQALQQR
jgi:hypothetical protein